MLDLIPTEPTEQISLDEPTEAVGISLEDNTRPPIPEKTADTRSEKAHYGWVQGKSPGKEAIRSSFLLGTETEMRERATSDSNEEYRNNKLDLVRQTTAHLGDADPKATNDFLNGLLKAQPAYTPDTVFEHKFASAYINNVIASGTKEDTVTLFNRALDKEFNKTLDVSAIAEGTLARKETFQTIAEDIDAQVEKMGTLSWMGNLAQTMVPGYSWAKMNDQTAVTSSLLPGSNLRDQVQHLWLLPKDEARKTLKDAVDRLAKDNPIEAQRLAHAAVAYGTSEELLTNIFGIADALTIAQAGGAAGKMALRAAKMIGRGAVDAEALAKAAPTSTPDPVRQAFKDSIAATEGSAPKPETIAAANGNVKSAAEIQAFKILRAGDPNGDAVELSARLPSLFNWDSITRNPGSLSREQTDRIVAGGQNRAVRLLKTLDDPSKVNRATDEAWAVGVRETQEELSRRYPHLNDAVLDVQTRDGELVRHQFNRPEDNSANVGSVTIHVGTPEAGLFESPERAAMFAEKIYKLDVSDPGLRIRQQGSGFYLAITKNVDETTDAFRNALITTKNTTPTSLANTWVGMLRTPEDTLSQLNRNNRHALTHATELIKSSFVEAAKDLSRGLNGKQIDRMERVFEANRAYQDSVTGQVGQFYQTLGQFEDAYYTLHKIRPTEAEHSAYFTYTQLNDMDWVIRNLDWYKAKARQGVENVQISHKTMNEAGAMMLQKSPQFEGKYLSEIPWKQAEDAGIYVVDGEGKGAIYRKNFASAETKADIDQKLKEGYRIVQLYNPASKPLGLEDNVHFIVAKDTTTTKLPLMQAPYRPGGHIEYADQWFTKQPKISKVIDKDGVTRHNYEGDVAAFGHSTEAEAKEFSRAMETGRQLLVKGSDNELGDHLARSLPYSLQQFKNLFQDAVVNGKPIPAVYSRDHSFTHTQSGFSTAESAVAAKSPLNTRYENFEDLTSSTYNLSASVDKKFAGTRDAVLPSVEKRGSETNPVFQLKKSNLLDPMATLNRSMANIMRSRMMNDYKTASVESWIQEFGHLMSVDKDTLRSNPAHFLHNPPYNTNISDVAQLAAAKNSRAAILNLLGTESEVGKAIRSAQSSAMDFIYAKTGQNGLKMTDKIIEHTPAIVMAAITDPAKFMRASAFHLTQGCFNPVQLALQAQTLTHVAAVGGFKNALPSLGAGGLMKKLSMTEHPDVINKMAQIAENMKFMKKEDFLESYQAFRKSGLSHIEGEVANLDDVLDPKLFSSTANRFLDKGVYFFRQGESWVRHTAWNVAYKEWKAANPVAELTNQARNEILTRSNLLGANMTRASSASWQQGVWSVPSQFYGYPMRLAEQMLGKRLTVQEKAHAMMVYAGMYGVPSAMATASAIPFYDDMKTYALDNGLNINSAWFKGFMEGIPSMMTSIISEGVTGKALDTNFAARFGSGGLSPIRDIAHGNMSLAKFVLGASGNIVGDTITSMSPLLKAASGVFETEDKQFPLKADDFLAAASHVSSLGNAGKVALGLAAHRYLTRNGVYVSDVTPIESLLFGIGLTPRRITDANLMSQSMSETQKKQGGWEKLIIKDFNRALEEGAKGNDELANDYLKRAKIWVQAGNFQQTQTPAIFTKALKGWEQKIDQVERNFRGSKAPADQVKARTEAAIPEMKDIK